MMISINIPDDIYSPNEIMMVTLFEWEFKSYWSDDIDDDLPESFYSSVKGFGYP